MYGSFFFVLIAILILISTAFSYDDEESPLYYDDIDKMKVLALLYDIKSLVIGIDFQNDFCNKDSGSLFVKGCPEAIEHTNELIEHLHDSVEFITTGDAHKYDDSSFASTNEVDPDYEDLWPDHCVEGTYGIELDKRLNVRNDTLHFPKTQYSALTKDMKNYIKYERIVATLVLMVISFD